MQLQSVMVPNLEALCSKLLYEPMPALLVWRQAVAPRALRSPRTIDGLPSCQVPKQS